jgi:hypothetical protein
MTTRFERRASIVGRSCTPLSHRLRSTSAILAAFAVPLLVYLASLRGDVSYWDTGDLQTVPYILGIPYPTGFPGFVLAGWVWSHTVPLGNVAWRLNLLGAVACAGTAAALAALLLALGTAAAVAFGAAVAYALAYVPWTHATYVDVHPIAFCAVAWAVAFAARWGRSGRRADGTAVAAAAAVALACDNSTVLMLPGIAAVALARRPPWRRTLPVAAVALLAVLAAYAYLPLRSAAVTAARVDPTLALGVPPGRPFWDDGHPATWPGFVRVVTGRDFAPEGAVGGMFAPPALDAAATGFAPLAAHDLGGLLPWLALAGGALLWWRAPFACAGLALLGAAPVLFASAYAVESEATRYYLPAYFVLVAAAAYAVAALDAGLRGAPRFAVLGAIALAWCALLVGDVNAGAPLFAQPGDRTAHGWIERVAAVTPAHAIVVAGWDDATPLAYGTYVLHALGDRIVLTAGAHEYASRYRTWLRTRPVVVVSGDPETFPGFRARLLDAGDPHLYALR